MGFLAELIATNRKLLERIDLRVKRIELDGANGSERR